MKVSYGNINVFIKNFKNSFFYKGISGFKGFIAKKVPKTTLRLFLILIAASYITALFVSKYLSYRLFVYDMLLKTAAPVKAAVHGNKKIHIAGYGGILKNNIFGLAIDGPLLSNNTARGFVPLSVKLIGTIKGGLNYGFFENGSKIIFIKEGAFVLPGYLLQKVGTKSVVISYGGKLTTIGIIKSGGLSFGAGSTQPDNGSFGNSGVFNPAGYAGSIVKKVGLNSYVIKRSGIKRLNFSLLYTQIHAVPDIANGKIIGYKVLNIIPGSVFWGMGIRQMDIIKDINGVPLKSPTEAINLLTGLQNENSLSLNILRGGSRITLNYKLE